MLTLKKISVLALAAFLFFSCTKERFIDEPGNLVPKTVDQDPTLPSITENGAMLHSQAFGHPDSTMIVVIHGGPGGDYRYLLNCADLASNGYRVVFYDQRGSGLSQRFSKKSYTSRGTGALDMLYDELSGVIAHYRTSPSQKVILYGHSWGGVLATGYAGKHPNAIQGLIVSEPGGFKWDDIADFVKRANSFKLWGEFLNDATYMDQFISGNEDQHELLDYKLNLRAAKNENTGEDNTLPGSFWRSGAVINTALFEIGDEHHPDFSAGINGFHVPVLFFYSERNKAYQLSWAQRISSAYNSVNLEFVSGAGHDGIVSNRGAWSGTTLPKIINYIHSL